MQEAIIKFIENSFFLNEKIKKMIVYWTGNIEVIDKKNILNILKKQEKPFASIEVFV